VLARWCDTESHFLLQVVPKKLTVVQLITARKVCNATITMQNADRGTGVVEHTGDHGVPQFPCMHTWPTDVA